MKENNYPTATLINTSNKNHVLIEKNKTIDIYPDNGDQIFRRDNYYGEHLLAVRASGGGGSSFDRKGFWLNEVFGWQIVRDEVGKLVLVPTKK